MTKQELETKLKKMEKKIEYLEEKAYRDTKFACLNRNWLDENKKNFYKKECAVIFLDINGLKKINDTQGHDAGDNYIQDILGKIKISLTYKEHEEPNIIRLGGDEFLILYSGKDLDYVDLNYIANIIQRKLSNLASMGYYFKKRDQSLYKAMKLADAIMYENKRAFYQRKAI